MKGSRRSPVRHHLGTTAVQYAFDCATVPALTIDSGDEVNEVVDRPNWIVSACLPLSIFRGARAA